MGNVNEKIKISKWEIYNPFKYPQRKNILRYDLFLPIYFNNGVRND